MGGKARRERLELVFHGPGDRVAVFAHQHEAQAEHDFALAVGRDGAAADLVADRHVGHVGDADGHAFLGPHDDLSDLLDARRAAQALHEQHSARLADVAAADVELFFSTAPMTSANVRSCLISRCGIDADLILLLVAAPTVDLGRARAPCASAAG